MEQSKIIMLVGLPMSGKSYSYPKIIEKFSGSDNVWPDYLSSDEYVENIAKVLHMNYDDVWSTVKDLVQKAFDREVDSCFRNRSDFGCLVVWDQTNLTRKTRAKKLAKVPSNWEKIAIFYPYPVADELYKRINRRVEEGKVIPDNVLNQMAASLEYPSIEEGFEKVYCYDYKTNSFKYG